MDQKKPSLKKNERIALEELKEAVAVRFNLLDYRIYGSKARGDDEPDSDIDLMITLDKQTPDIKMELYHLVYSVDLKHDSFISPVIFSKEELEEGPLSESPLYKIIMKEGIPL